jgi:predicted ATPase
MGVVYRAQHSGTGARVALKTVHVPRAALLQSIRREIHALLRLSHPGVVRVLDAGLDDELPWYAMELLEGPDLGEAWRARLGGQRPRVLPDAALRELLGIVRRLCEALAYLHGEGIVHRDLKPGNVFVLAGDRPVLVDFGLASRLVGASGREALQAVAEAGGTLGYMAPEQGRGQLVDARADLYSLGCMLYELLAGRPPFVGDNPVQVLWQHFEQEARPLSELVEGVPGEIEDLVLRLLAKDPRERIGHADDVAAALAALGAQDGSSGAGLRPRPYLYRSGFVGRRQVMERLRRRLEALQQGSGGLVLLGGESGAGKTRLAVELGREAARLKLQVFAGECLAGEAPALASLRGTLRIAADHCREAGRDETQRVLGPWVRLLARYEPLLATLPGVADLPEPAELPGSAGRLRLFFTLTGALVALGQGKPVLLLLDDLQWADELTISFLDFLQRGRRVEALPLLVVGTYRSEHRSEELQGLLGRCSPSQIVMLEPLDEQAVAEMAGEMLGMDRPPALFGRILASRSEGNPFFVSEYLHAAVAEALLYRDESGHWQAAEPAAVRTAEEAYASLPLPRSIRELVERRLEGLPAGSRALVEAAAVVGRQAPIELLQRMLGTRHTELFEASSETLRWHILEEIEPDPAQRTSALRFRHDQLREVALERLAPERKAALHRAAAEAMEQIETVVRDERLAELAQHWEAAGEPVRARSRYLTAAQRARGRNLHGEAVRLYRAYLRLVDMPDADSLQARCDLIDSLDHFGATAGELLEEQTRALDEARLLGDRRSEGRCLKLMARLYNLSGRMDEADTFFEKALAVARETGDRLLEGATLDNYASLRRSQGRMGEAWDLYSQALQIHRELLNRVFEGATVGNLAALLHTQGRMDEARPLYEEALDLHRETGSRRWEGHVLTNLGLLHKQQGRMAEAQTLYEQALANHQQIGDGGASFVLSCLADLHGRQGRLDQARGLYEKVLELSREFGDPCFEGRTLYNLGDVHQALGQPEEARVLYEQALELHRSVADRPFEGFTLAGMASLHFEQGRLEEADQVYGEAIERLHAVNNRSKEGEVLGQHALVRLAQGNVAEARTLCGQALALARETSEPLNEALALVSAARMERLGGGELEEASRLAREALARMRAIGERLELGPCLCEAGHAELALGRSAKRCLAEARRLVEELELGPRSARMRAVETLAHAQEAFEASRPLLRGQCPEDVPPALRSLHEGDAQPEGVASPRSGEARAP